MAQRARGARSCRFGPIDVDFDDRVLVPRPWTLAQSEWVAEVAPGAGPGPLAELCAGVGHIGLAAAVLADRDLVQVELDPVAASYARANADRAGWGARVEVRVGRLESAVGEDERFPLVLADPPYLPTGELARFPDDPRLAIDGGPDGLAVVRACLAVAGRHLEGGGALLLQVAGPDQAEAVAALVAEARPQQLRTVETREVDPARAIMLLRRSGEG